MSWVHPLLVVGLDNALGAALLAGVVFLITRCWRNPLVAHALWLLVLVKLVAPPVVPLPWGMSSASLLPPAQLDAPRLPDDLMRATQRGGFEGTGAAASSATDSPRTPAPAAAEPLLLPSEADSPPLARTAEPEVARVANPIAPAANPANEPLTAPLAAPATLAVKDPPNSRPWPWPLAALALWLAGSAAYLALATTRIVRFHRALGRMPLADERVARIAARAATQMGYAGKLLVRGSPGNAAPSLWAVGRPTILLPQVLAASSADDELSGILAHEIAHLVRRDPWVRWFELAVVALYWWHPVAWWASRALRDAEELACDARVVERIATEPDAYVRGLLRALEVSSGSAGPSLASGLGNKGTLQRRVEAMMARRYGSRLSGTAAATVGLVALAFVPLSMRASLVQDTPAANVAAKAANAEQAKAPSEPVSAEGPDVAKATKPPLDPWLGPGAWVDPQVREYLRNYMLRPEWGEANVVIKGRVVDQRGEPVSDADVTAQTNLFGTIAVATTDQRGEFEVTSADSSPALVATNNDGALVGYFRAPQAKADRPAQPYIVRLEPPRKVDAHVVDRRGQPVSAAIVAAMFGEGLSAVATTDEQGRAALRVPQAAPLEAVFAGKDNVGLDVVTFDQEEKPERDVGASPFEFTLAGARTITVRAVDGRDGKPMSGALVSYRLSRNGKNALLHALAELYQLVGLDGAASFSFAPLDETSSVTVYPLDSKLVPENMGFIQFDPQRSGNEYTLEFWPKVKLAGQVRFADGRPAPGMPVLVQGAQRADATGPYSGTTDAAGKFELEVSANDYYLIATGDKQWAAPSNTLVIGHESPPMVELTLGPAIRVFGRDPNLRRLVLTQHPATDYEGLPRSELLPLRLTPHPSRSQLRRTGETDDDGKYEFFVGPGTYSVEGPQGVSRAATHTFTLTGEKEYDVDRGAPGVANARVKVRIVRADDPQSGLGRARYYVHRFDGQSPESKRADADGVADVESLGSRFVIEALDVDEKLVGMVESKPGETELTVPLGAPAVVRGRLIDRAGRRFRGRVDFHVVHGSHAIYSGIIPSVSHGRATIGDDGRFVLDKLAPGWTYSLSAYLDYPDAPRHGRSQSAWLGTALSGAAPVDLGDIVIEP